MQRLVGVHETGGGGGAGGLGRQQGWYLAQKNIKKILLMQLKLTLAVQSRAVYYCRL